MIRVAAAVAGIRSATMSRLTRRGFAGDEGASNIDPYAEGWTEDNEWIREGPHLVIIVPPAHLWMLMS